MENPVLTRQELLRREEELRQRLRAATRKLDATRIERERLMSLSRSLEPNADGNYALGQALKLHTAALHELNQAVHELQIFLEMRRRIAAD